MPRFLFGAKETDMYGRPIKFMFHVVITAFNSIRAQPSESTFRKSTVITD
ncbi:MAG: hypothetical protein VYC65_05915 [Chloroflexota bacterium]|nr:hypothetical protein [Chloroflexota bacterium]